MFNGVSGRDLLQVALFLVILLITAQPLGRFIARALAGERTFLTPVLGPLERGIYRLAGIDPAVEQRWTAYAVSLLLFNLFGLLLTYLILKTQQWLPWNDQGFGPLGADLAFNTAVSFTTNTNWQAYSGESTVSNFTQMVGLAVHNFTSAATGIAIAVALARGLARRSASGIGNFWADVVRTSLYVLLPLALLVALSTIMITGDNRLTAATISAEAGVDDFVAEARPEDKIRIIRDNQAEGHLVAMTGDGTNDAPALAQSDVGLAMNSGATAAKDAANMVDLDSDPTKLIEVVRIGKQLLITRGAITTFSIANDVAKYFAIIPAAFAATYPELNALNVMGLATPESAILSAVIFNALIIIALIPLALRGVAYRALPAAALLRRNLLVYGGGGILVPFLGIKLIDVLIHAVGLA